MGLSRLVVAAFAAYLAIVPTCLSDAPPVTGEVPTLAPFLERITPAVVNISATGSLGEATPVDIPLADFLFDLPIITAPQLRSTGSGVIIDAETGLIMTNNHLVNGAERIVVTLKDKRTGRSFQLT
jgi:S1-C subfamily serine protease